MAASHPPGGGSIAALVVQTNEGHWVLGDTRAHQAHAVVGLPTSICRDLSGQKVKR